MEREWVCLNLLEMKKDDYFYYWNENNGHLYLLKRGWPRLSIGKNRMATSNY